jgi:N-acyl-D-aspartate/D-glutamate deacylase
MRYLLCSFAFLALTACLPSLAAVEEPAYDIVVAGGRVLDPESGLDAVRSIGIRDGKVAAISVGSLRGRTVLDASALVVAPGFIDLHCHGQDDENYRFYAMDGVTTALELEVGSEDVGGWYEVHAGKALINYGVAASHVRSRMKVFNDPGSLLPRGDAGRLAATPEQIEQIKVLVRRGLDQGGLGVGFGLEYTPAASRWEVLEMFRIAAERKAPAFVHSRFTGTREPGSSAEAFEEMIGAAAITGAPLHIVHINSVSAASTPQTLQMVGEARKRGLDITTEAYPYSAGMTEIESTLLDRFEGAPDSELHKLQWAETGERLTRETFQKYRKQGGIVILHLNTPEMEALAVTSPLTAIASDSMIHNGKGHPRTAGTYARVLGYYVRERHAFSLMDAIRKSALMPAQRLETLAPAFHDKGRLRVGADADIAVFDPATVIDRATFERPAEYASGFRFVLVNGVPIVKNGALVSGIFPGKPARAPLRQ